ncbi:hypothetical protein [Nesterenkonia ebinurensis]|uniref:hypothetical protein n=1 Tax=Nesterenkonia ebinurensis TaxID=2608252 RepID=UPI00123E1F65|nr:hypothetical protein [Nesterenkonia ebinurensis]
MKTTAALSAAAVLVLTACGVEDDQDTEFNGQTEEVATPTVEQESPEPEENGNGEEGEQPDVELPPGGAERLGDDDIDPEEQGEFIADGNFSDEGEVLGLDQLGPEHEPIEVYAAPPEGPGPHEDLEVAAELSADDQVMLAGREIYAAYADGIWVEVQLADGYGWIDAGGLEGFAID